MSDPRMPPELVITDEGLKALYELFPELVDFDQRTGEIGLFARTLESLRWALPRPLDDDLLIIGHYLTRVSDPQTAALAVLAAYSMRQHVKEPEMGDTPPPW